jgi:hypothetical protein
LKEAIASSLLNEVNDVKTLRNFIVQLESMQTTDFAIEIHRIKEKIKLIQDVSEANENKKQHKQNLEVLENLDSRISIASD